MDLSVLTSAMSGAELPAKVSTAVLDKTMDSSEAMGAGLVEMIDAAAMERSVNPAVGGNVDMRI